MKLIKKKKKKYIKKKKGRGQIFIFFSIFIF